MKKKILLVSLYAQDFRIQLALYYLKTYLYKYIQRPSLIDIQILTFPLNEDQDLILKNISKANPQILGFSCYVWNIEKTLRLSNLIKRKRPDTKIILGGPEASPRAGQLLKDNRFIDSVIIGEGERRFKNLIEHYLFEENDIGQVDGIAYRENGRIIVNEKRKDLTNLDEIPSPYLEGLIEIKPNQEYPLETMRGCIYKCHYCYYHKEFEGIWYFSLERIEKELKYILRRNPRSVYLMDPTFNVNKKRAKQILEIFIKYNKKSKLHIELKAELLDRQLVDLLHKAKTNFIEIGIQSTNKKTLKLINRDFNPKLFKKNVIQLNKKNLPYEIQLIDSLPQDNYKKLCNSIDWLFRLHPARIKIMRLMLLPGTKLRQLAARFKIRYDRNPPYYAYKSNTYSVQDLKETEKMRFAIGTLYDGGLFKRSLYAITKDLEITPSKILNAWLMDSQVESIEKISAKLKDKIRRTIILAKIGNSGLSLAEYLYKRYNHSNISKRISSIIKGDRRIFLKKGGLEIKTL